MTLYNATVQLADGRLLAYTIKTTGKKQFSVTERKRAIDYLAENFGRVVRIAETDTPHTLTGFIEIKG